MALNKAVLSFPFAGGVETKQDAKAVPPARLLKLQNRVFTKAVSLVKRNGYEALPSRLLGSSASYSDARALAKRGDELVLLTGGAGYSYHEERGEWSNIGTVVSVNATDKQVAKNGSEQTHPDQAAYGGVRVVAWIDARGGVWASVEDAATGRELRAEMELDATGERPRVCRCGELIHVYWAAPASGYLHVAVFNPQTPTEAPVQRVLLHDLDVAIPHYDAETTELYSNSVIMAHNLSGGGVGILFVDSSGVPGGAGNGKPWRVVDAAMESTGPLSVAANAAGLVAVSRIDSTPQVVTYICDGLNDFVFGVEWQGGALGAGETIEALTSVWGGVDTTGGLPGESIINVATEIAPSGSTTRDHYVKWQRATETNFTFTDVSETRGVVLASRAFYNDAGAFSIVQHDVPLFTAYFTLRSDGVVAGRHMPISAVARDDEWLVSVQEYGGQWRAPLSFREQLTSANNDEYTETSIRVLSLDFDSTDTHHNAQAGACLYIGGACMQQYDGARVAEAGFHYAPDGTIGAVKATGGALTSSATYLYRIGYEETNARGEIDLGPLSAGTLVTMGGSDTRVTLTIPTYRLTARRNVRVAVYRSEANDSSALYRVSSLDPGADTGSNRYVANDRTVDTVTFVDDMSDATLITKEPCYTNGGIVANDPTSSSGLIAVGKSRLFFTDPSDPLLVRYSKEFADGYGVEMSPAFAFRVDPSGGAITALAVMDDSLVIFKRESIFFVAGPGPLANPSADSAYGFSPAALITSDVGCIAPKSIGQTPVGLIFQSAKGVYMLGRDKSVEYVGAPVEAFNAQTVVRSTPMPDRTQIVLLTDAGETLLFDYLFRQWSTFTNHEGRDAIVAGDAYHYLRNDGRVFRETPGVYRDDNAHIRSVIETAWIKVNGLQGFQRIYHAQLLGDYKSPHTLRVKAQYDYEKSWANTWDLNVDANQTMTVYGEGDYGDGPYGSTGQSRYQEKIHVGRKCQAIRFRIEEREETAEFGAAFELTEISLTAGIKGPLYKLASTRSH